MIDPVIAAYIFSVLIAVVILFQLALAFGMPWGEMAMGGKYPGRLPTKLRVAAIVQMVLLVLIALVVLTRAGLMFNEYFSVSKPATWFVAVIFVVSSILNVITPSKKERALWAPITVVLLICVTIVARS